MVYTWENEAIEKYGEEVVTQLVEQQKRYEQQKQGNECESCGFPNQGAIIESDNGKPFIMHYGSFSYSNGKHRCHECGRYSK